MARLKKLKKWWLVIAILFICFVIPVIYVGGIDLALPKRCETPEARVIC